ncbi:MAG: hypothetical protein QOE34_306 [Verrucomicrobiota bacterium]
MTPFAEGIWVDIGPARILGMRLTTTMTVLRLLDGSLLLHSPLPLTDERRAAVEALGPVAHLYAPSRYHDLRIGEWAAAFPSARLHAPPGLVKERGDLRIDRVIGSAPEPAFLNVVDELLIEGFRLEETVLIYRPARTLVVADLVHNVGRPQHGWTKFYTRTMGFYDRVAMSRMLRWAAFSDRAAARRSIDELLTHPFDALIVGHGTPLTTGGREALAAAFRWLPPVSH